MGLSRAAASLAMKCRIKVTARARILTPPKRNCLTYYYTLPSFFLERNIERIYMSLIFLVVYNLGCSRTDISPAFFYRPHSSKEGHTIIYASNAVYTESFEH